MKKTLAIMLALVMALAMVPALAEGDTIAPEITSAPEVASEQEQPAVPVMLKSPAKAPSAKEQIYWAVVNKKNSQIQLVISSSEYTLAEDETYVKDGENDAKGSFDYDTVFAYGQVPWIGAENNNTSYAKKISSAAIVGNVNPVSTARWFDFGPTGTNENALSGIDLGGLGGKNLTNMRAMFQFCGNVETISFPENLDTSRVTNMGVMFNYCQKLKAVENISNWDTSKVEKFDWMFDACKSINNLDVSKWNTSSCTTMNRMFDYCISLEAIDVSNWNTSKVIDMFKLFHRCVSLKTLDLSKWDTSNVTNMYGMFHVWNGDGDSQLEEIKGLENLDVSKVMNMENMFTGCKKLKVILLDISKLPEGANMKNYNNNLNDDIIQIIANGGTLPTPLTLEAEQPLPTPIKSGHKFDGWYTDEEFTGDKEETARAGNTYYAKWTITQVEFLPGEGSGVMPGANLDANNTLTFPECTFTAPDGKEFAGWKITEPQANAGKLYQKDDSVQVLLVEPTPVPGSGNPTKWAVTVTAQWTEQPQPSTDPSASPTPTPGGGNGGGYYYPTPTPVPVIVIPPKTGDMTIWQSILHFLGIK